VGPAEIGGPPLAFVTGHIRGRVQTLLDMKSASGVAGIEFIGTPTDRPVESHVHLLDSERVFEEILANQ
jgi:hypothetical protein